MKKLLLLFALFCSTVSMGQVYLNGFSATSASPSDAPSTIDAHLSYSAWTTTGGAFTSFAGASGQALSMSSASATTTTWTLPLTVASGYKMGLTSFRFWNRASATGYTTWTLDVNGTVVGTGTISGTGASTGMISITGSALTAVSNLTGAVNVHLVWSGGTHGGSGTGRLDDFTLNGSVSLNTCSGTPTAGTAAAGTSNICSSGSSVITLSGASSSPGIAYQWQSSPDNTAWTNITGATSTAYTTPSITTTTYYRAVTTCTVSALSANSNAAQVTVTSISSSPTAASIADGSGTTFTAGANGAAAYQWQRSTTGTSGTYVNIASGTFDATGTYSGYTTTTTATSNTLTLTGVPAGWNGYAYRCVASNTCGNVISAGAVLTVTVAACTGTPAAGAASPVAPNICDGSTAGLTLSGFATGSGIVYQWQSSGDAATWSDVSGATNTTYTTPSLTANTYYQCITTCTGSGLSATSAMSAVTIVPVVTPTVTIDVMPAGAICAGATTTFTATPANGGATPAYQWKLGGADISGATNVTYSSSPANGNTLTCVLTSSSACASPATAGSNSITMTVNPLPSPVISGSTTIVAGASAALTFTGASGDVVYYWNGGAAVSTTLSGTTVTVNVTPTVTTTYSATSAVSAAGCAQTITGQTATITVLTTDTIPTRDSNMAMGNPSGATTNVMNSNNYLMIKSQYTLSYNNSKGMANWVSWHLSSAWLGSRPRCDCFTPDGTLPSGYFVATTANYTSTGFDRGHLCPSADRNASDSDNANTFLMTNMSPQSPVMNEVTWANLEDYSRSLTDNGKELYIIAGGIGSGGSGSLGGTTTSIASGHINVPSGFYKIIVVLPVGSNDVSRVTKSTQVIAVIMPNAQTADSHPWQYYRVSVDSIETVTGYNFLSNVPDSIQDVIEAEAPKLIAEWDLTGANTVATYAATTVNTSLDNVSPLNILTRGSTASASSGANSFRTQGFKNEGISTSNTDYFQVKVKAKTGYALSLSSLGGAFNGTSTYYAAPGVTSQFAYSLNGSTFTLIGSPVTSTSLTMDDVTLSDVAGLQNVPDSVTIYLRYYASGQTSTGGWGFYSSASGVDGFAISGTLTPLGPKPGGGDHAVVQNSNGLQVTMVPNPANDEVTVSFTSDKEDKVQIKMFNMTGAVVYEQEIGNLQNGSVNIPLKNMPAGIYITEVASGARSVVRRLIRD